MVTLPPVICRLRCQIAAPCRSTTWCTPGASWMVVGALPTNIPSTSMSAPGWLALMLRVAEDPPPIAMAACVDAVFIAEMLLITTGLPGHVHPGGQAAVVGGAAVGLADDHGGSLRQDAGHQGNAGSRGHGHIGAFIGEDVVRAALDDRGVVSPGRQKTAANPAVNTPTATPFLP